jgi:excisionase family DNA binding protein
MPVFLITQNPMPTLLTIREFAQALKASIPTVRGWIDRGVIPVYHVRHFIRIDRDAALKALADWKKPNTDPKPRRLSEELMTT